jgi:hypothetical protein
MQKTHLKTYANHVRSALVTRRDALKTELAVMFAVTIESDGNKRLARESIYAVWHATGSYQCDSPTARDWKAVGRIINAAFALWDFIGAEEISGWADGRKHGDMLSSLVDHIAPLKLSTVNEVLTICEKVKAPRKAGEHEPAPLPSGAHELRTEHIRVVIPASVRAEEVMTLINSLMKLANELLDANKVQQEDRKAA